MLVVSLGLVVFMMQQLRHPETSARLDQIFTAGTGSNAQPASDRRAADGKVDDRITFPSTVAEADATASAPQPRFREILALAGWDADRLAKFDDDLPLSDDQREELLELLRRLRTFGNSELVEWASQVHSSRTVVADPTDYRGELVRLSGRARRVQRRTLPPKVATRLEMSVYVECQIDLDDGAGSATVITARVPNAWAEMPALDEPASATGLFIKRLPADSERDAALYLSREVAWHPMRQQEPYVSFGCSVLGSLGMDVGLLDEVRHRRPIQASERDAFYQTLDAAGRAGANQLIRFANGNLEEVRRRAAAEEQRLATLMDPRAADRPASDEMQLLVAREVQRRAANGRYSVAPLFNDPEHWVGQLVVLDGIAQRAVRVEVGTSPNGGLSDVARRFGIDHYYEVDVFTDDSQDNPVVFCVRELPTTFPTGDAIREPVRVAGFFFKSWSFGSRRTLESGVDGTTTAEFRQLAPLLIGRGPVWLQMSGSEEDNNLGLIVGALFLVLLAGIWAAGWWFARGDRQFHERTRAMRFALPPGESLQNLDERNEETIDGTSS